MIFFKLSAPALLVLIETLWNVKTLLQHLKLLLTQRINRNIVECKASKTATESSAALGINRNIVECKV